jgi:hypothetical protein
MSDEPLIPELGTPLAYAIIGRHLTIRVPLVLLGAPQVLHFAADTNPSDGRGQLHDDIPDHSGNDPPFACIDATLTAESPPPTPAQWQ